MRIFSRAPNIDFMGMRRPWLIASIVLTVLAIGLVAMRGLNLGLDFTGGVLVELGYEESVELEEIRDALTETGFSSPTVQYFGSSTDVLIRLAPGEIEDSASVSTVVIDALHAAGHEPDLRRVEFVGSAVGDELIVDGMLAALFALLGILVYIAFRFEWKFGVGAVTATAHDAVMVVGWFALFGHEFDLTVLAGVLAVIGYSLNDTIVIYDRIRENFIGERGASVSEVVNMSVNQTLARTVVTGGSTLLVLFALFFFGGAVVHGFSIVLIVGVIVGTYSSTFIASSMVLVLGVTREDLLPPEEREIDEMP